MRNAGVEDRVQRILEQHMHNERMLDAYWQWATNPTPPAAGYALEENCGFIATNLLLRYGEPAIELVTQMAAECRELRREASVYDLQQAVIAVLNGPVGNELREGILNRINQPIPERRLLAAWLVSRARWAGRTGDDAWLAGEFDWSLGVDLQSASKDLQSPLVRTLYGIDGSQVDLAREALLVGVVNRLLYRNVSGRMEPKMRPGPRLPLARITY
ncbi:MAG TPA: hypothetical protein VIL07_07260 [Symbiobacteriaceae bacterium]